MSAKFLHAFSDENPELKKQIGCMTGILQMFDRQHLIAGRRHGHKKLTSGHVLSTGASPQAEKRVHLPQLVLEKNHSKSSSENKRISMESSRTSFSSSSCSSFSSLDGNKTTQPDVLSLDRTIFPDKYSKDSPKMLYTNADGRPPRYETQTARRSLDFRDVVKGSINRDSHSLSVKISPEEEARSYGLKRIDSPRPMQLSKSVDGSYGIGIDRNSRDLVLVKIGEPRWNFSEYGESPRSSFDAKDHRFSYDGREISRQSLDSRENRKLNFKLQEFPRLSLDSREGSLRTSNSEPKVNSTLKDLDRRDINQRASAASNPDQELVSRKHSASVVAKLMGLEAMPSLSIVTQDPKTLGHFQDSKDDQISRSPIRSLKDPVTPRIKDPDSIKKPVSCSRFPIEAAPWKQQRVPPKARYKRREAPVKQPESVCSEIEKRLKELEFQQSNNDLRALKQILDAMQAKGLLGTDKNDKSTPRENQKNMPSHSTLMKGSTSHGTLESPIVIMKPANSVKRSGVLDSLSGVKLHTHATMDKKKAYTINRVAKEPSDKKTVNRMEDNGSNKLQLRTTRSSHKSQQSQRENGGTSLKSSSSLSPRLQRKMLEAERSQPPLPSSDSSKPRSSAANRVSLESVSPSGKLRQKQVSEGRLSITSENGNLSYQSHENYRRSESNISLASEMGTEVTSAYRSADTSVIFQQGSRSPSASAARKAAAAEKQKKASNCLRGEVSSLATSTPEQPSPISVLDASFHQDDSPPSPLKKISTPSKDRKNQTAADDSWNQNSTSEINMKKLQSISNLVQKLTELSSTKDELSTTDHVAHLCQTQNPNHRYVSEILLASGLLFKDLSSGSIGPTPIKLHPSGHPINPDLFFVLEQTKTKSETINTAHRKLVFDVVNEILIQKLELAGSVRPTNRMRELPGGQQLLKELCVEIEILQDEKRGENSNDEIKTPERWGDSNNELPGLVLEIERLIFKDLIDEVVAGEAASCTLQCKSSRRRRQLFDK